MVIEDKNLINTIYVDNLLTIELTISTIYGLKKSLINWFNIIDIEIIIKKFYINIKRELNDIVPDKKTYLKTILE